MADYVRVLLREFYTALKLEIMDGYATRQLDDSILDKIIANPGGAENNNED